MRYIKAFEIHGYQPSTPDETRQQHSAGMTDAFTMLTKLMDGYALEIDAQNVESFLDMMQQFAPEFEIPKYSEDYELKASRYFFVMVGGRLLHTDRPTFGVHDLITYRPTF